MEDDVAGVSERDVSELDGVVYPGYDRRAFGLFVLRVKHVEYAGSRGKSLLDVEVDPVQRLYGLIEHYDRGEKRYEGLGLQGALAYPVRGVPDGNGKGHGPERLHERRRDGAH